MRMREILPAHVREWVVDLQSKGAKPPTIRNCKVVLGAILTTAFNDQITALHAGRGVKTPTVARKPRRILTAEHYDLIHQALPDEVMRLLVETDIETGLRWGELTELRPKDLDLATGILTVARVVVHLKAKSRPSSERFLIKHYPKDGEWRQIKVAAHLVSKIATHIAANHLGPEDLLFPMPQPQGPARRKRPAVLPDPFTLGLTAPNSKGRQFPHGTLSAYQAGKCRCQHCKDNVAAYRAARRAAGKDTPRQPRTVSSDGHISGDWFRTQIWAKTLETVTLGFHVTPHGLRHAHASWLLAGGADLQVVKERLGHGSIATTEKYLHALPNAGDAALNALDAIRGTRNQSPNSAALNQIGSSESEPLQRDAELIELRGIVAKFKEMLGPLSNNIDPLQ